MTRQQTRAAEVVGQAERDTRAARHEREGGARPADRAQVAVRRARRRRRTRRRPRAGPQACARRHAAPLRTTSNGTRPTRLGRLPAEEADEVRVGHRRERVLRHRRLGEQRVADEEVPAVDRAAVRRVGGADDGEVGAERVEQRVRDRPDVALGRRVEGRAVLEEELPRAELAQPLERLERIAHGVRDRRRARLQSDDDRIDLRQLEIACDADRLHRSHSLAHERAAEVGGAGHVVGDRTEEHAGDRRS